MRNAQHEKINSMYVFFTGHDRFCSKSIYNDQCENLTSQKRKSAVCLLLISLSVYFY